MEKTNEVLSKVRRASPSLDDAARLMEELSRQFQYMEAGLPYWKLSPEVWQFSQQVDPVKLDQAAQKCAARLNVLLEHQELMGADVAYECTRELRYNSPRFPMHSHSPVMGHWLMATDFTLPELNLPSVWVTFLVVVGATSSINYKQYKKGIEEILASQLQPLDHNDLEYQMVLEDKVAQVEKVAKALEKFDQQVDKWLSGDLVLLPPAEFGQLVFDLLCVCNDAASILECKIKCD